MATTATPVQLLERFCRSDAEGRVFCTPHGSTTTTYIDYIEYIATSISYFTITTSRQTYNSPSSRQTYNSPSSRQTYTTSPSPDAIFEEPPQNGRLPLVPFAMIVIIAGAVLLLGSLLGLYAWIRRANRKEKEYPGHRVLGMMGRSSTKGEAGGAAARSGNGDPVVEMTSGVASRNAASAEDGAAIPASTAAKAPAAVSVAGRTAGVLDGGGSGPGKGSGGEGGAARYA